MNPIIHLNTIVELEKYLVKSAIQQYVDVTGNNKVYRWTYKVIDWNERDREKFFTKNIGVYFFPM